MGGEEQQRNVVDQVIAKLEGKKVRVTYYASETVYYETVIEASTREEADALYYDGGNDLTVVDSAGFETYDSTEEEL